MTLERYIEIIKEFAANDPDLLHVEGKRDAVFSVDYDDAVSILAEIPNRMVLLLPPYDKHVYHNNAMGNVWIKNGLVLALQSVDTHDHKARVKIQSKAEQVLDRLYTFLFNKRNTEDLYGFDPASWNSESIGPVGTSHYGYYAELAIKDGVVL